jgi:hypothetical protein
MLLRIILVGHAILTVLHVRLFLIETVLPVWKVMP